MLLSYHPEDPAHSLSIPKASRPLITMGSYIEPRQALVERITKETKVQISLCLDGGPLDLLPNSAKFSSLPDQKTEHHASQSSNAQQIWIWTGVGFLDHMLHALAKHSGWSLRIRTLGDLASELKSALLQLCWQS